MFVRVSQFARTSVIIFTLGLWQYGLPCFYNHFMLRNTTRQHCTVVLPQQCDSDTLIKLILNNNYNNNYYYIILLL